MPRSTDSHLSRRDLLKATAAGAAGLIACGTGAAAADDKDPYGGLKMGMQSYSLRGFKVEEALGHTKKLGLKYWESFPGHLPLSTLPKTIEAHKQLLASAGITLMAYGVVDLDANETKARERFDFAKAMGMTSLSANPKKTKETFDLLDKLVAEYDVAVAIHNHGPGATYDKIDDVVTMVKDRHPKIGACVDTGHYLRSDEDPVEAIERLKDRLFGVHLKDVRTVQAGGKREKVFTVLGQGDLKLNECIKLLSQLKYRDCLSLEYEEHPENPISEIAVCLQAVRAAVAKLS